MILFQGTDASTVESIFKSVATKPEYRIALWLDTTNVTVVNSNLLKTRFLEKINK